MFSGGQEPEASYFAADSWGASGGNMDGEGYEFDVALSFAGEDRAYAELLARMLRDCGVRR